MFRNTLFLLLALATTSVALGGQAFRRKASVAHVLELKGSVTILGALGKQRPVHLFGTVYENDRLVLQVDSQVVLGFRANRQMLRLRGPGKLVAGKMGVDQTTSVEVIKVPGRHQVAVTKVLAELPPITRAGTATVRSLEPGRSPSAEQPSSDGITPIHRTSVLIREPKLSWPPVPNADYYKIVASDEDGTSHWSATTRTTALECNGERTLRNGAECYWTVTAALRDGTFLQAYSGKFSMATAEQCATARQVRALTTETEPLYSVLAAIWYIENGFLAEAIETTKRVADTALPAAQDPRVHRLLHRLYRLAGRHDDAQKLLPQITETPPLGPTPPPPGP